MVLVVLKNRLFGKSSDKEAFLPTARAYETVHMNNIDDEECIDPKSIITTSLDSDNSSASKGLINPRVMTDIIIGLSDGLTVPFALTAGLSSLGITKLVITGGLAELVSGALSMGLGGYLAAKSESEYYDTQVEKERMILNTSPETTTNEVVSIFNEYNVSHRTIQMFVEDMEQTPSALVEFIVRFGKGLEEPADGRQFTSAATIGISYFLGGFVPLVPYFFTDSVDTGLAVSAIVMAVTLFVFGVAKTILSLGSNCSTRKILINGFQMLLTGGIAAGAAWGLVKFIETGK